MKLFLHNTETRSKTLFSPIDPSNIRMYVCGPTVYNAPHLGNARPLIVFDVLFRVLKFLYPKVTYVRNITDIDDKIIQKALEQTTSVNEVVKSNLEIFNSNLKSLNILPPSKEPLATHYIKEMQDIIKSLLEKDIAYIKNNNVVFNTSKFKEYGKLSKIPSDELILEKRVIASETKNSPNDFILWKPSKENEPFWESPWGKGRPGWHIECSAMAYKLLGETFDIHGGGSDLIFPHHENERAQSMTCFNNKFMAKYWVHNAFITINNQKMSKSLGNFITINDLLQKHKGETLRLAILATNYKHPLNFNENILINAKNILNKMYSGLENTSNIEVNTEAKPSKEFLTALLDDLNTPLAISVLQKEFHNLNEANTISEKTNIKSEILAAANLLGILTSNTKDWFDITSLNETQINDLITKRNIARKNKDFNSADIIRKQLESMGITLLDSKEGTTWKKV